VVGAQAWRVVAFSWAAQTARHDKMVALVERMLQLNKRRGALGPPAGARRAPLPGGGDAAATALDLEIAATDTEIDELVYEVYGITEKERKLIQEG